MTDSQNAILNQSDVIERLGQKLNNVPLEDIRLGIHCILDCLRDALYKKQTIAIRGFGTFTCQEQPERLFYHPLSGTNKTLKARAVAKFKPGKLLQKQLND